MPTSNIYTMKNIMTSAQNTGRNYLLITILVIYKMDFHTWNIKSKSK